MKLFLKIVAFFFIPFVFIALILYINGITHVDFDDRYYRFFMLVNINFSKVQFAIPNIPKIEQFATNQWWALILNAFIWFVNGFFGFLNVIIQIVNYIIEFITYLGVIIYTLFTELPNLFRQSESSSSSSSGYNPFLII